MDYAELIETVEKLPPERQLYVLDFANFLAARYGRTVALEVSAPEATHKVSYLPERISS